MSEVPVLDLLTEAEAAQLLAIGKLTLAEWRRKGLAPPHLLLPSLGTGAVRAVRYRRTDVESFISTALEDNAASRRRNRP